MLRILFLIVLVWLLYIVIKRVITSLNPPSDSTPAKKQERIVLCSQCGLHVPETESTVKNGLIVCNNPQCTPPQSE